MKIEKINIAIAGFGNIGSYFYKILERNKKIISAKTGKMPFIKYISAKNINKKRKIKIPRSKWVKNCKSLEEGDVYINKNPKYLFTDLISPLIMRCFIKLDLIIFPFKLYGSFIFSFISTNIPRFYKAHSSPAQFAFRLINKTHLFYSNTPSANIKFNYDGNFRFVGIFEKIAHYKMMFLVL